MPLVKIPNLDNGFNVVMDVNGNVLQNNTMIFNKLGEFLGTIEQLNELYTGQDVTNANLDIYYDPALRNKTMNVVEHGGKRKRKRTKKSKRGKRTKKSNRRKTNRRRI
jgi:hypothetical protein